MSTTTTKASTPKKIFGLSAEDILGFHMENGNFAAAGHQTLHVVHHSSNSVMRSLAEKFGARGIAERLIEQGMGFLQNRKSKNGKTSLFDSMIKKANGSAAETDLVWLSPTFPKVTCALDPRNTDPSKRHPIPTAPVFLFFDYPPSDPVNSLVPGKKLRCEVLCVLEFTDGSGNPDALMIQCAKTRVMSLLANEGKKVDISFLNPRIRVSKMVFNFVEDTQSSTVKPTDYFAIEDPSKPVAPWNLTPISSGTTNYAIRLSAFNADELEAVTWQKRLLELPAASFNMLLKAASMWDRGQWQGGIDQKVAEKLLESVEKDSADLMVTAGELFPEHSTELAANTSASHRLLYILGRVRGISLTTLPKLSEALIDENLIIRPNV